MPRLQASQSILPEKHLLHFTDPLPLALLVFPAFVLFGSRGKLGNPTGAGAGVTRENSSPTAAGADQFSRPSAFGAFPLGSLGITASTVRGGGAVTGLALAEGGQIRTPGTREFPGSRAIVAASARLYPAFGTLGTRLVPRLHSLHRNVPCPSQKRHGSTGSDGLTIGRPGGPFFLQSMTPPSQTETGQSAFPFRHAGQSSFPASQDPQGSSQ